MDNQEGTRGWAGLGDWDQHPYTTVYTIDKKNQLRRTKSARYSVLCGDLNGKEIQRRGGMHS